MAEAPFTSFNFLVEIEVGSTTLCKGAFSEVDGLEMSMEPKTIREGGNNAQAIHLMGPVKYGNLTLKRGMTADKGLWDWFESIQTDGLTGQRGLGVIVMMGSDHSTVNAVFVLTGCMPVKVRAPSLNAKDGAVAIEEMQIAYETLVREL